MREMRVVVDVASDALAVADVRGLLRQRRSRLQSGERQHCADGDGAQVRDKPVPSP